MVTLSETSWNASRSPVQMTTSWPCSTARWVSVAMTSSASYPSMPTCRMRSASSTSCSSGTWPENSVGVAERPALYSGYSAARNVLRETSNATPTCVGASSRSTLMSIDVNPYTAFVCCPVLVEKFSAGRAKNAR